MDTDHVAALGARLDRLPLTAFHHRLALIVAAGLLIDGIDVYITAGVSGALLQNGVATLAEIGQLAMWTTFGLVIGGAVGGFVADKFGRLRPMFVTVAIIILGGVFAATAPTFQHLIAWRFVSAIGLGADAILAYGLLVEFAPPHARGRWLAWVAFLANLGLPLCLFLAHFILPLADGWRVMIAIPALAAIIVLLLRFTLMESPRWLASAGRYAQADQIVTDVEALAVHASAPPPSNAASPARAPGGQFWPRLAVAASVHMAAMAAVFGFVSWLPTFFATTRSISDSTLFAGIMAAGSPIGTLLAFTLADRFERKWSTVAAGLAAAAFGVAYAFAPNQALILALGLITVALIYAMSTLGTFSYVPELFDTHVRLRAVGAVLTLGRLTALAMPLAVVPLFQIGGQKAVIALVVAMLLVQAATVAKLGPRTKGISIEAI
jgi:putative MFS transporter